MLSNLAADVVCQGLAVTSKTIQHMYVHICNSRDDPCSAIRLPRISKAETSCVLHIFIK